MAPLWEQGVLILLCGSAVGAGRTDFVVWLLCGSRVYTDFDVSCVSPLWDDRMY